MGDSRRVIHEFNLKPDLVPALTPTVSLKETMLVGVTSVIAFQTSLQVRNRMVQALENSGIPSLQDEFLIAKAR